MDNTCIEQAMDNPGKEIVLAGKSYRVRECGQRRNREILAMIGKMLKKYPGIMERQNFQIDQIDVVNEMLDFIYDVVPNVKKDKALIDEIADIPEILAAFQVVVEVSQRPLPGGLQSTAHPTQATQETSFPSGDTPMP
jgi:hypothetical protein